MHLTGDSRGNIFLEDDSGSEEYRDELEVERASNFRRDRRAGIGCLMTDRGSRMKKEMAGLYAGDRVRVERNLDGGWRTEVKLRDCGEAIGVATGYMEGSDEGLWTHVGTYRTMKQAQKACDALFSGSHVFRSSYGGEDGWIPGTLVPFPEASEAIAEATAPKP